jgi:hypothetical protein
MLLQFEQLPHGWLAGIPRDVRRDSRMAGTLAGHELAVAPTRNGNFCESFANAYAGCRARPGVVIGATTFGGHGSNIDAIAGDLVTSIPASLFVTYGAGPEILVPTIWVSDPIGAGFFFIKVPPGHTVAQLTLRRSGRIVAQTTVRSAMHALASRGRAAYRLMVNTRLRGGLLLARGDRVVCRNPGRWLAVTLPAPNTSGIMLAKAQIVSAHSLVRLTVTKNVVSGQGVITCARLRR